MRNKKHVSDLGNIHGLVKNLTNVPKMGRFHECDASVDLLVFVESQVNNVEQRNLVRNTWGSWRLRQYSFAQVFFVIGTEWNNASLQQTLQWEQDINEDLIQGEFNEPDWDEAMSDWKFLTAMEWSIHKCPEVPMLFWIPEEAFVDLTALQENVQLTMSSIPEDGGFICATSNSNLSYCQHDIYLISNGTRTRVLESTKKGIRVIQVDPPTLSSIMFQSNLIDLVELPGLIWQESSDISDATPILFPSGLNQHKSIWSNMLANHDLKGKVPPVLQAGFSPTSYKNYVIENPDFCRKTWPDIKVLVVIHSNPKQTEYRNIIRETWADPRVYDEVKIRPLFFVGRSPDPTVEDKIRMESVLYNDIVQTDYLDSYQNLTFKAISWMQWVESHCSEVRDLVKTDDDIVVDVFKLDQYLKKMRSLQMRFSGPQHLKFHCLFWRYGHIIRNENHKHYISPSVYSGKRFPAYCSGSAFILSTKISQVLLDTFRRDPQYLWIDDVFITGILAKKAGVKHHSIDQHILLNDQSVKRACARMCNQPPEVLIPEAPESVGKSDSSQQQRHSQSDAKTTKLRQTTLYCNTEHVEQRAHARTSWASKRLQRLHSSKVIFIVGSQSWDQGSYDFVRNEQENHSDLILGEYGDMDFPRDGQNWAAWVGMRFRRLLRGNQEFCSQTWPDIEVLILVQSHPSRDNFRDVARHTWGNESLFNQYKMRFLFFMARTMDFELDPAIDEEQKLHQDIVQFDFMDAFQNEPLKSVGMLQWTMTHCPQVRHIVKVDDDIRLNVIELADFLQFVTQDVNLGPYQTRFKCVKGSFDTFEHDLDGSLATKSSVAHFGDQCSGIAFALNLGMITELLTALQNGNHVCEFQADLSILTKLLSMVNFVGPSSVTRPSVLKAIKAWNLQQSFWSLLKFQGNSTNRKSPLAENALTLSRTYVIENPDFCRKKWPGMETLAVVHSNPNQVDFRDIIRQTWGDPRLYLETKMRVLFFLGTSSDPTLNEQINAEQVKHEDLVQTAYLDSYRNMTLKALSWMQWVESHCSQVQDIFKTDDDIVVDVFRLGYYLKQKREAQARFHGPHHLKFHCIVWRYGPVIFDHNHRHFIPQDVFRGRRFPAYCSGSAYILSQQTNQALLNNLRRDPKYLWIDDVFITGILAKNAGVRYHTMFEFMITTKRRFNDEEARKKTWPGMVRVPCFVDPGLVSPGTVPVDRRTSLPLGGCLKLLMLLWKDLWFSMALKLAAAVAAAIVEDRT
eukprot:snap_masked-scaffold353_size198981-processed-gene-0.10 protein:Tk05248 transcript:snap_masked-scaffold353_size198981-processed-gene-0.10-mRNA-1 annotation:"hypothetical protein CAPTEDRAFT_148283"